MDEKDGRSVAAQRQIPVAGTVGVLERAAAQGLIDLHQAFTPQRKFRTEIKGDYRGSPAESPV